jgi:hypothetical protein
LTLRQLHTFIFDGFFVVARSIILALPRNLVKSQWTMCEDRVAARQAGFLRSGQGSHPRLWEQIIGGT